MEKESTEKNLTSWFSKNKKKIIIGTAIVGVTVGVTVGILKSQPELITFSQRFPEIDSKSVKKSKISCIENTISNPVLLSENNELLTKKPPINVKEHIRNLPKNHHKKKKKIEQAIALGITLSEESNCTIVNKHTRRDTR